MEESPRRGRRGSRMAQDQLQRNLLQQRAELADFGRRAAEGADLDQLLNDAAEEAARSLDVSFVKVLEYLPDEKSLLVRAGVGWGEGVVGQARIGADIASPAGYALQTGQPVIANDLDKEERFRIPELLHEHGVRSAVNVIIKSRQHIFGVLEADSREPRVFADDDVKFLQGYATILAFAIDQARLVELNAALADEKAMLLRELGHRVRNNNQQLMSLINLQLGGVTNTEARDNLEKIVQRIRALTSVNQQLEGSGPPHLVDLGQYLLAITGSLFNFQGESAAEVKLETEIAQVEIATERAQAIGLIVNEFLTNSFKHAFRDRGGVLTVRLSHDDRVATLALADDGPGTPDEAQTGLGMKLINVLCRQIDAEAAWQNDAGTRLTLQLPIKVA
ncbi:MAG TPA: GAF domain-containing protein [Geminicoccaceae bacterium]|nr:GAF domain-containing protein [Geminicoccaceae bacterium]